MGSAFTILWFAAVIALVVVVICITIAPLIIWRNTNRTNRLLAELLVQRGVDRARVLRLWTSSAEDKSEFDKLF